MPKPNITALLTGMLGQFQVAENTAILLRDARTIDNATGELLSFFANLVTERRAGRNDDTLRPFVRARVAANKSSGTALEIPAIIKLLLGSAGSQASIRSERAGIATAHVYVDGVDDPDLLATLRDNGMMALLHDAVKAGERLILTFPVAADGESFAFEGGSGLGFTTFASLDLNPLVTSSAPLIYSRQFGETGNTQTIALVADGTGVGGLEDGEDAVFHFESGVTTLQNFRDALDDSLWLRVYDDHGASGAALLGAGDVLAATLLSGGVDGGLFVETLDNATSPVFG
jgi:hypothetical protein